MVRSDEDKEETEQVRDKCYGTAKGLKDFPEHRCNQNPRSGHMRPKIYVNMELGVLAWLGSEFAYEILYCPFCGRHAEEIALEFVDDKELEVAESGS